jgi:hypothetical protein
MVGNLSYMHSEDTIEDLQPVKLFPEADLNIAGIGYRSAIPQPTYYNRHPFTKIISNAIVSPPIKPPPENAKTFWVYKKGAGDNDTGKQYLELLPYTYMDRTGRESSSSHAIFFVRKDFLDDAATARTLSERSTSNPLYKYGDDGRFQLPFKEQIISYTPDDKVPADLKIKQISSQRKTWILCMRRDRNNPTQNRSLFNEMEFPVYLQMFRANILIEHLQQYSKTKLNSLVEYDPDFFRPASENPAKLILRHTKRFYGRNNQKSIRNTCCR